MSVLRRSELEESPLADLHAIASELGLEGYRTLRKADLIVAIVAAQGGAETPASAEALDAPQPVEPPGVPEPPAPLAAAPEEAAPLAEAPEEAAPLAEAPEEAAPLGAASEEAAPLAAAPEEAEPDPVELAGPTTEPPVSDEDADERAPVSETSPQRLGGGVLDILTNGSGFLRVDASGQTPGDVYVSPAQIRRCELRAGDEVEGPVRPPRRSERHPSLVRVETVNGAPAEPPEQRPHLSDLTPVFPSERLPAPPELVGQPYGKGSRVAIGGPPGAGTTRLLREAARTLRAVDVEVAVVLVGTRPEEVTDWSRQLEDVPIYGGGFDRSPELQAQAAELAVERAKRTAERGGDTVLVVDSLENLPPPVARRVFAAARKIEEGGSVTVIAATGVTWEPQRQATTRVMLDPPRDGATAISEARSGVLRGELLS